ncbi:MAG: hypothetical protein QOG80_3113, partial [Pseudonocardiales bacterium]|nr:hypothetical protein [Pseudonocardiales bacterium]
MTSHERFAHDDAAYLLGALSSEDRAEYEAHLATCDLCRASLAEISTVPGMLAGITEADLEDAAAGSPPPDTLLPRLMRAARSERRTRRWVVTAGAGLAAAAIVALSV